MPNAEVRLDEAVVVPVERAQHRRPRPLEHEQALTLVDRLALALVDDLGQDPGERPRRRAGLGRGDPRQRRDHDRAGLGLPPGVDDRAALAADHLVVPEPRLRVDRLADRAEQAQRGEVELVGVLGAPLDAGADRRRRGVEDRRLVVLDELPPDPLVRVVRRALVHHPGRAVGQRPVDDVGVAGDPADVGAAPVDVGVGMDVEHVPMRARAPVR